MDKKDFILKNYSRLILCFSAAWLLSYWGGKKFIGLFYPMVDDVPIWVTLTLISLSIIILSFRMIKPNSIFSEKYGWFALLVSSLALVSTFRIELYLAFIDPMDHSLFQRLIISFPALFLMLAEWYRQSRIWDKLPWEEGDLVKPKKAMDNRFMVVLSSYIPKGKFTGVITLLDGENVFNDTGKSNYRLFFKDSMNFALEKGFVKPNVERSENGVIIIYQHMAKFLSKVFGKK